MSTGSSGVLAGESARTWSLQREWSWAFLVMFLAVVLGAAATVIGVRGVMSEVDSTASRFKTEADIVAGLGTALDAHERAGILLLSGATSDPSAFIQRQQEISALFEEASMTLPTEMAMRADVLEAHREWQEHLAAHGLWADQVQAPAVNRLSGGSSRGFM